jgi:hypothetical protein
VWEEVGAGSATGGGISNNNSTSDFVSLAIAANGTPYIAWSDSGDGDTEIYVRRWNGASWEEVGTGSAGGGGISNNSGNSFEPRLVFAPDNTPYVAWYDVSDGDTEIYVRSWNGSSWIEVGAGSATGGGISNNTGSSIYPAIAVASDGTPYITWEDNSSGGDTEIFVRRWNGSSWVEVGNGSANGEGISNNSGVSSNPSLALGIPYIAWYDDSSGNNEIYVRRWNGADWEEVGIGSASGGGVSNNSGESGLPALIIAPNSIPFLSWYDTSGGNYEIYVKQWLEP